MRLFAALVASTVLVSAALAEDQIRAISVVCDEDYPPYAMRAPDGSCEGIVPDQWAAWEKATGIRVELRAMPWAEAIAAAEAGAADVLDMAFETPSRRLRFDFSPPYATIQVPVFIHKSVSGIASPSDLAGFSVGVKQGDASVEELRGRGVSDLVLYRGYEDIVDAAARLDLRIFCVDKPPALYYLYKKKIDGEFRIAFTLGQGQFHRAVLKGRAELLSIVEQGFGDVPAAAFGAIERKWMGYDLSKNVDLRVAGAVAAIVVGVVVLLLMNAWALGRRVRAATADLHLKISQLEESEARNRASIAEKEVLLKEIHHRVKNNLQIVTSLIQLKADELKEEDDRLLLVDIRQRILALAQLHELLYQSRDLASIDAGDYLDAIARDTARAYSWPDLRMISEPMTLGIDEALPLGLIANELLINAMKYAYPADARGQIRLVLARDGESAVMRVEDNGVGLPGGVDPAVCDSMGFTIVRGLAQQLLGTLRFGGPPGFWAELRAPRSRTNGS